MVPFPYRFIAPVVLLAAILLAGCGDDNDDATATSPSPTEPAQAQSTPQETTTAPTSPTASPEPTETMTEPVTEISISISDGEVTPPPDRVEVDAGSTVRISVTGDEADEIHVHGYELTGEVPVGGGVAVIEFEADQTGLFEVESHHLDMVLVQLQVQ